MADTETPSSAQRGGGSIADRLASLQKSGEEAWRRRVGKHESSPTKSTSPAKTLPNSNNNSGESPVPEPAAVEPVKLRTRTAELQQQSPGCTSSPEGTSPGGTSIASRLSWLGDAQQGWRDRVGEKDMARFTVHGKLSASNGAAVVCDSPLSRRVAAAGRNPLSRVTEDHVTESPLSAARGRDGPEESIAKSSPNIPATLSVVVQPSEVPSEPEDEAPAADSKTRQNTVSVARPDDETFTSFYDVRQSEVVLRNKVKVSVDDFDHLFMESENILTPTRGKARPQTRKNRASRNPVRALAARDDVQEEYREEIQGVAERELKRMKREQVVGKATLASEALAGLASTENFDKTKLRKAESFSGLSPGSAADKFLPYTDTMLLQVKGRRNCQTRLVAPTARSVNSGDAFVLVRPDRVFVWLGTYCNVIERAKAMDVASTIQQKRDLGCKSALEPIVLQETTGPPAGSTRDFWAALGGGHDQCQRPGPPDEDEVYEAYVNQTNMAYRVHGDKLVPVQTAWGQPLKHAMLEPKHMYVLDFGSEVYLWTGKQVAFASRKTGLGLLQEVWDKGYDYSSCDINPLSPLHTPEQGGMSAQSSERPAWALLGKVNQNMETVLFREKFSDWPEPGKLIRVQAAPDKQAKEEGAAELVPCDAAAMLARCDALVDLVLEGSHVGRGDQWLEREDAIERLFVVKTLGVTVWHVLEFETLDLPPASHGHFHEADTYVIKWSYRLMQAGIKSLKTKEFSSAATGRDKCAYFFWQGRLSSIAEKGASALMTVELDEERGPQVCVVQGKEPAAFLRLFHGTMATHLGKREDASTAPPGDWRLFLVRHEIAPESCLQEVPAQVQSLRSRASLLLLNTRMGQLITWHGAAAAADIRRNAAAAAQHIKTKKPAEMGVAVHKAVSVTEVEEGAEGSEFWAALGAVSRRERSGYHSHRGDPRPPTNAPRLWYLSSVSGAFEATELISPTRSADHVVPFTATQADLLKPQQPALFLVDDAWTVYVWQGAWPDAADDSSDVTTGSALSRFVADRACALQTALDYSKARGGVERTVLVYGGLEPLAFTNLFPDWATDARKRTKHLAEGHTDGETVDVGSLLRRLTDTRYSWAELTGPDAVAMETLPEGVDPARLEQWLRDDDFRSHLGVTREEFEMLPRWKKTALKRESGLF